MNCLSTMISLNIKRIVYSSINDSFISCDPKEIKINHISSGNRHLIKNSDEDKENYVNNSDWKLKIWGK